MSGATETSTEFVCECQEAWRRACAGEPFFREHQGKRYCVLHYPGTDKRDAFHEALKKKIEGGSSDFSGVSFPEPAAFGGHPFRGRMVFNSAKFNERADFSFATFEDGASFNNAVFAKAAAFAGSQFNGSHAFFMNCTFESDVEFTGGQFDAFAEFRSASFGLKEGRSTAKFDSAIFKRKVDFKSATFNAQATFKDVVFEAEDGEPADFSETRFIETADFGKARFKSEASFEKATFGSQVDFSDADFAKSADFSSSKFLPEGHATARFYATQFGGKANFLNAVFGQRKSTDDDAGTVEALFYMTSFADLADFEFVDFTGEATFSMAEFAGWADFRDAVFQVSADFTNAKFFQYLMFEGVMDKPGFGKRAFLSLQHATIEKAEDVRFHTLTLRPHWFLNVDARKFVFANVQWSGTLKEELASVGSDARYELLSIAYRNLALNAEETHHYRQASDFRYHSMEAALREHKPWFRPFRLEWWYRLVSGYGERIGRAFFVLLFIWFAFAVLYTQVDFTVDASPTDNAALPATNASNANARTRQIVGPLRPGNAAVQSLSVMALQKTDTKPATLTAQALVLLETILGPLQAALLALAVRRRFMR